MTSWYTDRVSTQVPVRLSEEDLALLDAAVERGRFANRSEAIRAGLARLLREERDREIEDAYRRGYGAQPQEGWVGEAGLALLARAVTAERDRVAR